MFTFLSQTVAKKHQPLLPDCNTCGLLSQRKCPKQTWNFPPRRQGVIVVNSPDPKASDLRAGKYEALAKLLTRVGASVHDYAIVPVAACPSPNDDSWKHCQPLLMETLKRLNPEKILVYGNKAIQSLLTRLWDHPTELTDRFIGRRIPCRELNAWVCPIGWIGVEARKNPVVSDVWAYRHAKSAAELSGRPYDQIPAPYEKQVVICYEPDQIRAWLMLASDSKLSAFDYETTGLKPEHPKQEIVTCSVAWQQDGEPVCVAFPFSEAVKEAWIGYLRSDSYKVAANAKFEQRWSKQKLGVDVKRLSFCTMITAHCLDPQEGITGLKFQAFIELGLPFYAGNVERYFASAEKGGNAVNRIYECNMHELLKYNALDSILELELAIVQRKRLGIGNTWSKFLPSEKYYENQNT